MRGCELTNTAEENGEIKSSARIPKIRNFTQLAALRLVLPSANKNPRGSKRWAVARVRLWVMAVWKGCVVAAPLVRLCSIDLNKRWRRRATPELGAPPADSPRGSTG